MMAKLLRSLIVLILFLALLLGMVTYFVNKPVVYEGEHKITEGNTVSIILIDGMSQSIFEEAIKNGKMPFLKALTEKGIYVKNGIGSFPSMTGYAFYPFITGVDAIKSGILGLRWFDRSRKTGNLRNYVGRTNVWMNQDINNDIKTIFELSGNQYTASINTYMNKGVSDARMTGWAHTTAKYEGKHIFGGLRKIPIVGEDIAKNHFQHEEIVMNMAMDQLENNPKVQWVTLPSPDASNHVFGTTDQYYQLLTFIDQKIEAFYNKIVDLDQVDTRLLAVITDHGVVDVNHNIDFIKIAREKIGIDLYRGKSVNYRSMQLNEPIEKFIDKDGYFVINGNLSAYLYFRNPDAKNDEYWESNLSFDQLSAYPTPNGTINIPQEIANIEGIEIVGCKMDKSRIRIYDAKGYADIIKRDTIYEYLTKTSDPFSYRTHELADTAMSAESWLSASIETSFPDAVYRLYNLFQSPQMGDLVITSTPGYDLAADYEVIVGNYKGGHGGINAEQLRVPYLLYNPSLPPETYQYKRSEDVGKIIKEWTF